MQRYSQTWSGDNDTAWQTLEYNNKMALGLSMSGVYNVGHDVGGFTGPAPEPELLARWFFIGAMSPRFGVNSWKPDATITEPWMHPEVLPAIQKALALRMRLLPQLYSLMADCHRDYAPLLRPTFMNFPDDPECFHHDTEFMWGENLLVAPVLQPQQRRRQLYLPACPQGWWDFEQLQHYAGGQTVTVPAELDQLPLFVRGGSALFLAVEGANSIDGPEDERLVHLYPGGDFQARFYDDDGETYAYRDGGFLELSFKVSAKEQQLGVEFERRGDFKPGYQRLRFITPHGWAATPAAAEL